VPKDKQASAVGEQIGSKIRELRISHGLTQAQLANAADIAQSSLYQIEHARVLPSIERLCRIAEALNVPVTEFFSTAAPTIPDKKRKAITALEAELLTAFAEIEDLAGKRLVIQLVRRLRTR